MRKVEWMRLFISVEQLSEIVRFITLNFQPLLFYGLSLLTYVNWTVINWTLLALKLPF